MTLFGDGAGRGYGLSVGKGFGIALRLARHPRGLLAHELEMAACSCALSFAGRA